MKIGLNIGERMNVLGVLPKESNFVTLRMINGLIERLGLTAQELQDFEVREADGMIYWNESGSIPIDYEFIQVEIDLIKKQLVELDSKNKLHASMLTIYEKFVR